MKQKLEKKLNIRKSKIQNKLKMLGCRPSPLTIKMEVCATECDFGHATGLSHERKSSHGYLVSQVL